MRIKLNINIEKKYVFMILVGFFIIGGIFVSIAYTQQIPNPGHGGDRIMVSLNGEEKTLQQAIDDGNLGMSCRLLYDSRDPGDGSKGGRIPINVPDSCLNGFCTLIRDNYDDNVFQNRDIAFYSQAGLTNDWVALTQYYYNTGTIYQKGKNGNSNALEDPIFSNRGETLTSLLDDSSTTEVLPNKWSFIDVRADLAAVIYICT